MAIIQIDGLNVEYRQAGAGDKLLLPHSLLTEMSVFDEVLPFPARALPADPRDR